MIVVKVIGGLGNQMFQYALGRKLADDRSVPLRLDLTWFDELPDKGSDTARSFALDGWRVRAERATEADLARFPLSRPILKRLSRYFSPFLLPVVVERSFRFDPRVLSVPRTAYLNGYWQSAKYFASIERVLRTDFSMNAPACPHSERLIGEAGRAGSISLHIRRGDYVNNPSTNSFHGVCTVDYYKLAAKRVADEVTEPHFLVFSDDLDWARKNIKLEWPTSFVEHDSCCVPHNDIWLMSLCSHHIIANSSFSWWGAWLSTNPGKVVVAPKQWFRQPGVDTIDLIPANWVRI